MSPPIAPPPSSPSFGSIASAVLPYASAIIAGVLAWFASQFSATVRLSKTLFDASRLLVADSQAVHARDGVRISELEQKVGVAEAEVIRMRGEVNGSIQREQSLRAWVVRQGLEPPPRLATLKTTRPRSKGTTP